MGDNYKIVILRSEIIRSKESAAQALEVLQRGDRPDLILQDVMMPETDGFSLMGHLQYDPELNQIPVIFVTGMTDTDDEIRGYFSP